MGQRYYFTIADHEIAAFDSLDQCVDAMVESIGNETPSHYAYDRWQDLAIADIVRVFPVTYENGEPTAVISLVIVRVNGEIRHYYPNAYRPIPYRTS